MKLPPRLFANVFVLLVLASLIFFMINFWQEAKIFLTFNSYAVDVNNFVVTTLASQLAGEFATNGDYMLVQIYSSDDFDTPEPDLKYPNICFNEYEDGEVVNTECPYGDSTEPKSCNAILEYLNAAPSPADPIAKKDYSVECKDKFCLCMAKFTEEGHDNFDDFRPSWWGNTEGDYNDKVIDEFISATGGNPSIENDYVFDINDGIAILVYDKRTEVGKLKYATFAFNVFTDTNFPNKPENYEKIKDAAANNCFEFFGVNELNKEPEDIFEEVVCKPIEGTDTEERPLFLIGIEDINAHDAILLSIRSDNTFKLYSTIFIRQYELPEIGMEYTYGG